MPGNQVRRGSEQPDRGRWMPWDSGAEETGGTTPLVTSVHRGRAHLLGYTREATHQAHHLEVTLGNRLHG